MGLNFMDPENAADVVEAIKEYVDSHGGGGSVSPVATWTAATIEASDWDENVYSFETAYPSSRYDIQGVQLAENATDAQRTAFKAMDSGGYTSTNIIVAHGTVPSIDIPVMLGVIDKQAVPQDGSQWISYQDYQALTEQEKMDGTAYFVYNWPDSGVTVKGKVFVGTRAEWNALSSSEKATYDKSLGGIVNITDDSENGNNQPVFTSLESAKSWYTSNKPSENCFGIMGGSGMLIFSPFDDSGSGYGQIVFFSIYDGYKVIQIRNGVWSSKTINTTAD